MSERIRVYIAGPISKGNLEKNIEQADVAFFELLAAGYAPFCPHWSCYAGGPYGAPKPLAASGGVPTSEWLEADLPWVAVADAVLRLPGESDGADREVALARSLRIPVFQSVSEVMLKQPRARSGHPGYLSLLAEMAELHRRKAADYGSDEEPLANIRASEDIGIAAHVGSWLRAKDKVRRIDKFFRKGSLVNESVEDSLMDLAAYSLITLVLLREKKQCSPAS